MTGSYPGGSEVAMAAVRSAFAAAGGAYDSMQRAVRQVVEIAQAGGTAAPGQESPAPARRKATA